jgi:hypothetical protein
MDRNTALILTIACQCRFVRLPGAIYLLLGRDDGRD